MEPLVQQAWGWLIALYLFLGGMGGATMIVAHYFYSVKKEKALAAPGSLAALIMVIVGTIFLILDLEKPELFYLALAGFQTSSWIFRGTLILSGFMLFAALYAAGLLPWFKWVPWHDDEKILSWLGLIASGFGLGVMTYTGVLLGVIKAIPFWNTPALPALFVASALSTGISAIQWINIAQGKKRPESERQRFRGYCTLLSKWDAIIVSTELFILVVYYYLMSSGPVEAATAVRITLFGDIRRAFMAYLNLALLGGVLMLFVYETKTWARPGLEDGWKVSLEKSCFLPLLAALLIMIAGLILRVVILQAGVMAQLTP